MNVSPPESEDSCNEVKKKKIMKSNEGTKRNREQKGAKLT